MVYEGWVRFFELKGMSMCCACHSETGFETSHDMVVCVCKADPEMVITGGNVREKQQTTRAQKKSRNNG